MKMSKLWYKYSILGVTLMVTLYSIFAKIKMDTQYPYFRPFNGPYMILLMIPLVATFLLEEHLRRQIDLLRYIRFITSLITIVLLVITISGLIANQSNVFGALNLVVDISLGLILILIVIMSISLENTYYRNTELDIRIYLKELKLNTILTISLLTLLVVEIALVLSLGILGVRV